MQNQLHKLFTGYKHYAVKVLYICKDYVFITHALFVQN